jgi:hypothetical protein
MKKVLFVTMVVFGMAQLISYAGNSRTFSKIKESVAPSRVVVEPSQDPTQEYDWEPKHITGQRMIR